MPDEKDKVRTFLRENPLVTRKLLAQSARVSRNTLTDIDKPDWAPRPATLHVLTQAVDRLQKAING